MSAGKRILLLDLRGLLPSPDRLLRVVEQACGSGQWSAIAVDWAESFPWRRHPDLSRYHYPEQLIPKVVSRCREHGVALFVAMRSPIPPAVAARKRLRHIERASRGRGNRGWTNAMIALLEEQLDDLFELDESIAGVARLNSDASPEESLGQHEEGWHELGEGLKRRGKSVLIVDGASPARVVIAPDVHERSGHVLGSMEFRLALLSSVAGVPDSAVASELHLRLGSWRDTAWSLIGRCYEELARGVRSPLSRDADAVDALSRLRSHVRSFRGISSEITTGYRRVAEEPEIARFLDQVEGPVRERLADLAGRIVSYRRYR